MTALELIARLLSRGVTFSVNGDRLHVSDPGHTATPNERAMLAALKPMIRSLLIQQLPDRRGEHACDGFDAAAGAALCERCAFGLPDHFWRRSGDCAFFAGAASEAACRRCGVPRLEHLGAAAGPKTEAT